MHIAIAEEKVSRWGTEVTENPYDRKYDGDYSVQGIWAVGFFLQIRKLTHQHRIFILIIFIKNTWKLNIIFITPSNQEMRYCLQTY